MDGSPPLAPHGRPERARPPWGGLGDVMGVPTLRLDVEPKAARLGEAARDVAGEPGVELEPELGRRPAAEVDGRAGERVVHGRDGVPEARNAAPVAEGVIEGLAERNSGILDGVMLAGLQVAGRLEDEVEARVERELLQEVVVDPRPSPRGRGLRRRGLGGHARASRRWPGGGRAWPQRRRPGPGARGRATPSSRRSSSSASRTEPESRP